MCVEGVSGQCDQLLRGFSTNRTVSLLVICGRVRFTCKFGIRQKVRWSLGGSRGNKPDGSAQHSEETEPLY